MRNIIDLSPAAIDDKRLFIAYWPGEDQKPEVWTYETVKKDFGSSQEVLDMVMDLEYEEELYYKEGNLVLLRVPSYLNLKKHKYDKLYQDNYYM